MGRLSTLIYGLGLAVSVVLALSDYNRTHECPCSVTPCLSEWPELVEHKHRHRHHLRRHCEHERLREETAWHIATQWIGFFSGGNTSNYSDILSNEFTFHSDSSNVVGLFGKTLPPGEVTLQTRDNFLSNMPLLNTSVTILAMYHGGHSITIRWVSRRHDEYNGRFDVPGISVLELRAQRHYRQHGHHDHHRHGHHCHWRIIHAFAEWNNLWQVAHTNRCESLCHKVSESGRRS